MIDTDEWTDVYISFQVWSRRVLDVTIYGHPTKCLKGAHKLGKRWSRGPWHMTRIEPTFKGPLDRDWSFRIRMELK